MNTLCNQPVPSHFVMTWRSLGGDRVDVPYEWDAERQAWVPTVNDRAYGSIDFTLGGWRLTNTVGPVSLGGLVPGDADYDPGQGPSDEEFYGD